MTTQPTQAQIDALTIREADRVGGGRYLAVIGSQAYTCRVRMKSGTPYDFRPAYRAGKA